MIGEVSKSFLEEFDFMFHQMLAQRGSQLMNVVQQEQVVGAVKYLRQVQVGDARFVEDHGAPTQYTNINYDRRKLEPKAFECPLMLNVYDSVMQGMPDPGQLAQEAADRCGVLIDQIVIGGIGGKASTAASGDVVLPSTQVVKWNENTLSQNNAGDTAPADGTGQSTATWRGLNVSKVSQAVQMLRSKFNNAPIILVADNYSMSTFRADPRAANLQFNVNGPAQSIGQNGPFAGVDMFVPSEQVDSGLSIAAGNAPVTYAYVYALDQIRLGSSMPLTLDVGKNAERGLNDVFIYRGMYDCVRMQEEAVVRIEINKSLA